MKTPRLVTGFLSLAFLLLFFAGCAPVVPMNKQFYNSKKVGVVLEVSNIGMAKSGSQGLLDMALTPGDRFKEPLQKIEKKIHLKDTLQQKIARILGSRNKAFVFLPDGTNYENLPDFSKPKSKKKFPKKDFRSLKGDNEIDEVLYINVKYGLLVSYYGVIETGKQGYVNLTTQIIDLTDNSFLQAQTNQTVADIKGNWKSGADYENLKNAIQSAVRSSMKALEVNLQEQQSL